MCVAANHPPARQARSGAKIRAASTFDIVQGSTNPRDLWSRFVVRRGLDFGKTSKTGAIFQKVFRNEDPQKDRHTEGKVRVGRGGMGTRGGARVIYILRNEEYPVFLIGVFAKSEKSNLTKKERNDLRARAGEIFTQYRRLKR
jgi:hypothetical protein